MVNWIFNTDELCTSNKPNWIWQIWVHKILTRGSKKSFLIFSVNEGKTPTKIWANFIFIRKPIPNNFIEIFL